MRYLLLLHPPLSPARHGPTRFGPFSPQKAPFPPGTSPPFPEPPGPASAAHPTRPRLSRRHLVSATRPWPRFPGSPPAAGHSSYVGFFCGVTRWGRRPDALSSLSLSISPGAADLPTEMCVFFFKPSGSALPSSPSSVPLGALRAQFHVPLFPLILMILIHPPLPLRGGWQQHTGAANPLLLAQSCPSLPFFLLFYVAGTSHFSTFYSLLSEWVVHTAEIRTKMKRFPSLFPSS